jgi:hypothetical protein
MMAGLVIENATPIILDSNNAQCEGPKGLFGIVVDEFKDDVIARWHIEDKYGESSRNLGGDYCKSLDTIAGRISSFVYDDAIRQLKWTHPSRVNRLIKENEQLRKKLQRLSAA